MKVIYNDKEHDIDDEVIEQMVINLLKLGYGDEFFLGMRRSKIITSET